MPSRGNYWQKGGLPDKTVTEDDLGPTLQAKINESGRDPLTTAFFEDEFVYNDTAGAFNKYGIDGTGTPVIEVLQSNYGKIKIEAEAGVGNFAQINTRRGFSIEDSSDSMSVKFTQILTHDDIANNSSLFGFVSGYTNNNNGNTQASMMGATSDGFGYFVDINQAGQNYRIFVNNQTGNGDSSQVIDTGVRASFGFPDILQAEYTAIDKKVKFTLSADFPRTTTEFTITATEKLQEEMLMVAYVNQKTGGTAGIRLNYWSLEANRETT